MEVEIKEYDLSELQSLIDTNDVVGIKTYMESHGLTIVGNKIVPINKQYFTSQYEYWDMMQHIQKILLNSEYGAQLNVGSRFFDSRIGQSVTLTGRCVVRHMMRTVNELTVGEYDHHGPATIYGDTDSVEKSTMIRTLDGSRTIEILFHECGHKWQDGDKEYAFDPHVRVLSYNPQTGQAVMMPIKYVYRHRVSKPRWKITDTAGNSVVVTGDHSVMVMRNGMLVEAKPSEILHTDMLVSAA